MGKKGRFLRNPISNLSARRRQIVLAALAVQVISLLIFSYLTFDYLLKEPEAVLNGSGIFLFPALGGAFILSLGVNLLSIFTVTGLNQPDASQLNKTGALENRDSFGIDGFERPVLFERDLKDLGENEYGRQILRLFRNVERLDDVEKDLIRRLAENHLTDPKTERLLSEVQICTCRLLKQLSDFHLDNSPGTKTDGKNSRTETPVT